MMVEIECLVVEIGSEVSEPCVNRSFCAVSALRGESLRRIQEGLKILSRPHLRGGGGGIWMIYLEKTYSASAQTLL